MSAQDHADRLRNILCSLHHKKIQFINVGIEDGLVFVCSDCLKKHKQFCMANMNEFVAVDEFKLEFVNRLSKEMDVLKGTVTGQINHMNMHLDEGRLWLRQARTGSRMTSP
jgi:hypothetical protein